MPINRGGRIAQKASNYYSQPSRRDANVHDIKRRYGSVGVDCLQAARERLGQSDFFIFHLTALNLRLIQEEDLISTEDFIQVIRYATVELGLFDKVLFEKNILFSIDFVRNFDKAGLFHGRKYGSKDCLKGANSYRAGHPPLTIEDELELIIIGSDQATPSSTNKIVPTPIPPISTNPVVGSDEDLPF